MHTGQLSPPKSNVSGFSTLCDGADPVKRKSNVAGDVRFTDGISGRDMTELRRFSPSAKI